MPQQSVRIEYDPFVIHESETPDHRERHETAGSMRASHLAALFFLLRNVELSAKRNDFEDVTINLQNLGELGVGISEGILHHIEMLAAPPVTALAPIEKEEIQ